MSEEDSCIYWKIPC